MADLTQGTIAQEDDVLSELIGATIRKVFLSDQQHYLVLEGFDANEKPCSFCYKVDREDHESGNDSDTWFAEVLGLEALVDTGKIIAAKQVEIFSGCYDREEKKMYCIRLKTAYGVCDIIYRNSSNGYYGGGILECEKSDIDEPLEELFEDFD